ncbi:MAG TPA: hypothetical protein VMO78_10005, partial [Rhizomicrobium sp.]|nr:hypothetical protein [Rhizomicrobium sp.]
MRAAWAQNHSLRQSAGFQRPRPHFIHINQTETSVTFHRAEIISDRKGGNMERPSHIIFEGHQSFSRRAPLFAMAIGLQLAGFWLFTHGLASHVSTMIHPFTFVATYEK